MGGCGEALAACTLSLLHVVVVLALLVCFLCRGDLLFPMAGIVRCR